ncbi:MAG: hypothetical protein KDC38_20615 [Planctomycetes bacterium]|nr:hypothetical protein [Planctomycetota bacterium]
MTDARRNEWRSLRLTPQRQQFLEKLVRSETARERLKLGVFSSTTWRPIEPFLTGELLVEDLALEIEFHEYEGMVRELASGEAALDVALLVLDSPDGYGGLYEAAPFSDEEEAKLRDGLTARVERLARRSSSVLVALPPSPSPTVVGTGGAVARRVRRFVDDWE